MGEEREGKMDLDHDWLSQMVSLSKKWQTKEEMGLGGGQT